MGGERGSTRDELSTRSSMLIHRETTPWTCPCASKYEDVIERLTRPIESSSEEGVSRRMTSGVAEG